MKITIDNVKSIHKGIWKANIDPCEIRIFGDCRNNHGDYTVIVLLEEKIDFNEQQQKLVFNPQAVQLLNIGGTDQVIIIKGSSDNEFLKSAGQFINEKSAEVKNMGDKDFLNALPSAIRDLGESLLFEIRKQFRGELKYHPRSGKYVETPDNFWTVRIQPRDKSLRIIVRGYAGLFKGISSITIKNDMNGYSSFKISNVSQIGSAVSVIRQASQK